MLNILKYSYTTFYIISTWLQIHFENLKIKFVSLDIPKGEGAL